MGDEVERTLSAHSEPFQLRWQPVFPIATALYAVGVVVQRHDAPNLVWTVPLVLLGCIPLVLDDWLRARYLVVRRVPELVFAAPSFVAVLILLWRPVQFDIAPFLLLLVTVQAAVTGETLDGITVAVVSAGIVVGADLAGHYSGSFVWVLGVALAWMGGFAFRCLFRLVGELQAAQADLSVRAAADERRRIAREIHDVIAHSLSVAALHITGARMAVVRDRADAVRALEEAERLTRESLGQVRAVIGMLEPSAAPTAPAMPTAADITDLIEEFRRAGVDVYASVDTDLARVLPAAGLTLYRVTQESLTNAVRHAPGAAVEIRLHMNRENLELDVTNRLTNSALETRSEGRGLRGMRERANAQGGSIDIGANDGNWRVRLLLPRAAIGS